MRSSSQGVTQKRIGLGDKTGSKVLLNQLCVVILCARLRRAMKQIGPLFYRFRN